jgi:hypothetical protein
MMEKAALADEGGGVHAHPLSLQLPSRTKLQCRYALAEKAEIHPQSFISTLYVLCGEAPWGGGGEIPFLGAIPPSSVHHIPPPMPYMGDRYEGRKF